MEEKKEEVKQNAEVETGNEANNKTDTAPEKPQINMDAQVIGELETEKQKGVFGLIIFFVILIGVTFGLPYIKEYLDKRNAPVQDNTPQEKTENSNEQIPEEEEIVYYEIGTDTTFDFNDLNFSALNKENSDDFYLSLTVSNTGKQEVNLNEGYFIELYTSEKTLIERVKVVSNKTISSEEKMDLKLPISENAFNNATLLTIDEKTAEDYPEVTLNNVENDLDVLSCTNNGSSIKYYFKDDKLQKISDIYEYTNTDATKYSETLREYTSRAASLNNNEGVTSNIVDTSSSFTMNTQIDLEKANVKNLNNNYYFAKDTAAKTVKFEMEAMRFTCN